MGQPFAFRDDLPARHADRAIALPVILLADNETALPATLRHLQEPGPTPLIAAASGEIVSGIRSVTAVVYADIERWHYEQ
jgi:hypothetical protein